jgi:23S rRNA (uridine2552-2'-O)-methyltransferase
MKSDRRKKKTRAWLREHINDEFVRLAQKQGYRSRAAYKLKEIDKRDRLLRPGLRVVDLGAAPGGWTQYAKQRIGSTGKLVALDILPMDPIPGVYILQEDFTEPAALSALDHWLQGKQVDLVISDMAPNISGIAVADQAKATYLAELALDFASRSLRPGGSLLIKTFQGEGFPALRQAMLVQFGKLVSRKPKASRVRSREIYLLGKDFRAG